MKVSKKILTILKKNGVNFFLSVPCKLLSNMISILEKDKEIITIEDVIDFEDNSIPKSIFKLQTQSLEDEKGYWLDSGEFILNVRQ